MASIDFVNFLLLIGSAVILVGIFSSLVANRFGAPLLLVFLVLGMLFGQDGLVGIAFDDYALTYLVGSLALSIILFDGGLRTKIHTLTGALGPSVLLSTAGVLMTAVLAGGFAWLIMDLPILYALLLGSIVASTDAAAVFFLLRAGGLQLRPRVKTVLEMESGTNDPFAVFLTILLTELILTDTGAPVVEMVRILAEQAIIGGLAGLAGGFLLSWLLNRLDMPGGLHPLLAVTSAVFIFGLTSLLGGSGFLAVYLAGLVLGNRPVRGYPIISSFHDAATWLCQIVMFLVLGLLVTPSELLTYAVPGLAFAVFLMLVARPLTVWLCLRPFGFSHRERGFIAWVGLRGAVSIFLAAIPTLSGMDGAPVFFNVAFFVVLVSLLVQGWTINSAARRLGMALRRTVPDVSRIEIDLPGQADQELVGYPIQEDSFVLARGMLPSWVRPLMVARRGEILSPSEAGPLEAGDYAYFLAPLKRVARLDRLFAASGEGGAARRREAFGEMPINGEAAAGDLCALYGLELDDDEMDATVSDLFWRRLDRQPQAGDRLFLGRLATLIARNVEGKKVTRAGLLFEELVDQPVPLLEGPAGISARRWSRWLRSRIPGSRK